MGSDESRFNVSWLWGTKSQRQCPRTTTFEEKGEPKQIRTEVPLRTSVTTTILGGSCHKYHFCRGKTRLLSRQKYVCHDKTFASTKVCLSRQNLRLDKSMFVTTKLSPRQKYVCHDKTFASTKVCLSRQNFRLVKSMFVTTKLSPRQRYVCHDKTFASTKVCLSRQNFRLDKSMFVTTKLRLVFVTIKLSPLQNYVCRDKNETCGNSRQWYLIARPKRLTCFDVGDTTDKQTETSFVSIRAKSSSETPAS